MPDKLEAKAAKPNTLALPAVRVNVVGITVLLVLTLIGGLFSLLTLHPAGLIAGVLLGLLLMGAPQVAKQWEKP